MTLATSKTSCVEGELSEDHDEESAISTRGSAPSWPSARRTYGEVSAGQLEALSRAIGVESETQHYLELQRFLFHPWADYPIPEHPSYPSMIGDDHSPYEYSLAFSGKNTELRILFEAQSPVPSARGNQEAAELVNQRLKDRFNVDLSRFDRIRELFLTENPEPPFSLWHAVCLNAGKPPAFKIYLNPAAQGPGQTQEVVFEALNRLGFGKDTLDFLQRFARRGRELDPIRYFSLDLSGAAAARVKVYFAHLDATASELEDAFSLVPAHRRGELENYCDSIPAQRGPFTSKPLTSCLSFIAGNPHPSSVTLHVPIAHYAADDSVIARRTAGYLNAQGMPAAVYTRALAAIARTPLDRRPGLQSYASYRREAGETRFTVYLSPQLFLSNQQKTMKQRFRVI